MNSLNSSISIVVAPLINMRKMPDLNSEIVSQTFFSEQITILQEENKWYKITTLIDNYTGWIEKKGVYSPSNYFKSDSTFLKINRLKAHLYQNPEIIFGPLLTLPFESQLIALDFAEDSKRWINVLLPNCTQAFVQRGDITTQTPKMNCREMCEFSLSFLGLPYTWGGRSSFGYDCSGFVQMLYRQRGIYLPRDSKDQYIFLGLKVCSIENLTPGDLLFFGLSPLQIQHVGLFLGEQKFIHACAIIENKPYIRISDLKDPAWNGSGYYSFITGCKT